ARDDHAGFDGHIGIPGDALPREYEQHHRKQPALDPHRPPPSVYVRGTSYPGNEGATTATRGRFADVGGVAPTYGGRPVTGRRINAECRLPQVGPTWLTRGATRAGSGPWRRPAGRWRGRARRRRRRSRASPRFRAGCG